MIDLHITVDGREFQFDVFTMINSRRARLALPLFVTFFLVHYSTSRGDKVLAVAAMGPGNAAAKAANELFEGKMRSASEIRLVKLTKRAQLIMVIAQL